MSALAARYARAFADVVMEQSGGPTSRGNKLDLAKVQQQLDDFAEALAGSGELREALTNPAISLETRIAVLDAVAHRMSIGSKVRNFLAVLTDHGRLSALGEILTQYRLEINRRSSISEAEVVSARRLEERERAELENNAAELAGTAVHATFREDESLIGGAIVRIGSKVYDGSVRGRLNRLRERLVNS